MGIHNLGGGWGIGDSMGDGPGYMTWLGPDLFALFV